ncbi:MAG: M20 family metallopeptidase [Anaerolineales bacterium]|nr:M20 family metallopeptidase [Anaerolineales bacterium]
MNFDSRKTEMIDLLRKLVETESPTDDKKAVDQVGAILVEASQKLGASVTIHPQEKRGDHILARWGTGEGGILLLGHMDTVFPLGTLAEMPLYEKEGKIFGPGVLDMKSGLVIILTAIAALRDAGKMPRCPISVLFTSDEEVGSQTSRALIEKLAVDSDLVLVLESALPDGSLKTWRKGVGDFTIRVTGRAAHAGGAHADGRNAIEEMAYQILKIQKLTDYEKGTTLNVGMINGGTAGNVVPETAEAKVDLRVLQEGEYERITLAMQSLESVLEGTSIEVSGELNRPPMPFDATMEATFEKAQNIATRAGILLKAGGSGGASDGNFVAPLGVPLLDGLGAVGEGLHSSREYVLIDSLVERTRLLAGLLQEW